MTLPDVSIIIPCLNEERTIQTLLESILGQTYPVDNLEVIIADGMSVDQTRQIIARFQRDHPELRIQVCDNPMRKIPTGLNIAIRAAKGVILTRMDAHAIPALDYIERSITALKAGLGDNVGGVIDVKPGADTWIARGISIATAHPLGVGDAKYRWTKTAGEADTVAFGTYYKSKVEEIGYYNEALKVNEDYEFNSRLRQFGGKIWIDPLIRAIYYSRPTLKTLSKQYFTYGFWKLRMLRLYPETLRWRQALPPLFVFSILMLLLLSVFSTMARILLLLVLCAYLIILIAAASRIVLQKSDAAFILGVPLAIMTMHFSWGSGFWWSLLNPESEGT
ncbi:MAG: putative glycosyltransferase [Chloroflexi bacterium]|nr:MAG: putative glycosyltransferase [Chloroflexota bacterium]MBA4376163.1 glycosyltransferase family 2 protein [Anaerolinea sp.]